MERTVERDYFVLLTGGLPYLAHFSCELDSGFVGFATRITDEHFGGLVHRARFSSLVDHQFGQLTRPGVVIEVRGMDKSS